MVIASINVNGHLLHLDEIKCPVKENSIHTLAQLINVHRDHSIRKRRS